MCTLLGVFFFGGSFLKIWHYFLQKYRANFQNSVACTTNIYYGPDISLQIFKYDTNIPNKSIHIFMNYGLSLIIIGFLAIKEIKKFHECVFFCVMKFVLCNQFSEKPDIFSFSTKWSHVPQLQLFGLTVSSEELSGCSELTLYEQCDPEGCSIFYLLTWPQWCRTELGRWRPRWWHWPCPSCSWGSNQELWMGNSARIKPNICFGVRVQLPDAVKLQRGKWIHIIDEFQILFN